MKRSRTTQEVLIDYFDELLTEESAAIVPEAEFQDPALEQQQKLEKLLLGMHNHLTIAAAPVAVKPVEIQEWEIDVPVATPDLPVLQKEPAAELLVSAPPADLKPTEVKQVVNLAPAVDADLAVEQQAVIESALEGLHWAENGLPQWAQKDFEVLLFQVSGLTLAVPLMALGQIQPLTDDLTPLFGQADWFMGLLPTPTGKVRTVNTAKFVMPERYDEAFVKTAKYVISIDGVPWGLAVDSVNQPITLRPDDVKWRTERTKRPWLAGTVKEHMCALLDVPRIAEMLMSADRNWRASSSGSRM
jgi:purine-binding chemotaxis protein CheW